jgi:ketosteroid isomerase-like protein
MTLTPIIPFLIGTAVGTTLMAQVEPILVSLILSAIASTIGYLVLKVIATDRLLTAHIAADTEQFKAIERNFVDVKDAQRDQTTKLDRLLEHTRDTAEEAVRAAQIVRQAARVAADVVATAAERAKTDV